MEWSSNGSVSCNVTIGDAKLSNTNTAGEHIHLFTTHVRVAVTCESTPRAEASRQIDIEIKEKNDSSPDHAIKRFSVGDDTTGPVKLNIGDSPVVAWQTAHAISCQIMDLACCFIIIPFFKSLLKLTLRNGFG